jgi:CRP-like cAMP-binding protein
MQVISTEDCKNTFEKNAYFFPMLTSEEKSALMHNINCIAYKKGEVIFSEGDKGLGLYFISSGKVKIYKDGIGIGREQIVRLVKPLGFIGFRSFFAEDTHSTSAMALEDSVICIIPQQIFNKIIQSNYSFTLALFKFLASEIGLSYNRLVNLTQKHLRGRLAESLLFIKDTYGLENDGITLSISMTREELANLSNMTTSNAIRTLSSFAIEGLIKLEGKKIKILDYNKLNKISTLG